MHYCFNPLILLFTAWATLLPAGILIAIFKRKSRPLLITGLLLILLGAPPCLIMGPFYLWQFDALRGWELRLSADDPPYEVTLVQEPGCDFYNSTLEITRHDGTIAEVLLDADDGRWWRPAVVKRDGRTYFVRGSGKISKRTSYVDVMNDTIYGGYYRRYYKISELKFKAPEEP